MVRSVLLLAGFAFAVASLATSPLYGSDWGYISPLLVVPSILCASALSLIYRKLPLRVPRGIAARIAIGLAVLLLATVMYVNAKTLGMPEHHNWQSLQFFLLACFLLAQQTMRDKPTSLVRNNNGYPRA